MMTENYEDVNHLVLNFYPDGYSIAVKLNEFPVFTSETILETAKISYEETGLLDYIANEELPPLLVEMIDNSPKLSQYKIWRDGCLVLEVRDKIEPQPVFAPSTPTLSGTTTSSFFEESHKGKHDLDSDHNDRSQSAHYAQANLPQQTRTHWFHNFTNNYNNHRHHNGSEHNHHQDATSGDDCKQRKSSNYFVVLKPTNLSMLYDVLNLTSSKCWSAQQRLQLESQIVLHNSPELSLEPDASKEQGDDMPNDERSNTGRWAVSQDAPATVVSGPGSNKYSRFGETKSQRQQASHKSRLKSIYLNRPIQVSHAKSTNGNQVSTHHPRMNNIYHEPGKESTTGATESLPPELTLQQFLAARRATRRKSLPIGQIPRFHRFKRNVSFK